MTGDDALDAKPLEKRRVWRACQNCRMKKIKCSGEEPTCLQCSTSGSKCTWSQTSLTQNWAALTASHVQALEARVLGIDSRLSASPPTTRTVNQPFAQESAVSHITAVNHASQSMDGVQKQDENALTKKNGTGRPLPKNGRRSIACDNCRSNKIKCDKALSICSPCLRSGSQCTTTRGREAMDSSYIQELEATIFSLESRLSQIAPGTGPSTSLSVNDRTSPEHAKTKIKLSCDNCRRIKLRCDKSKPTCSHCTKSGLLCSWFHATDQDSVILGQHLKDLEARVLRLEDVASKTLSSSSLHSSFSVNSGQQTTASLASAFSVAEIPMFNTGKGNSNTQDRQCPRGRSQHRSRRTGSLPNPHKSDLSLPSQLTAFPPPPPLPSKNYDAAEKRHQREQKRQRREETAKLRHQEDGGQQFQGQGHRRSQEFDNNDSEDIEWRHYTVYGDLRSRSLSSSRLTERDPVLSRPFSRPTSRPSSVAGASPLTPRSSKFSFPLYDPYKPPSFTGDTPMPLSSSHLAKPLPLPSDLKLRLQRAAKEQEWGRTGNRYSSYGAYKGSSRRSSPHSIPSRRYSRPPSPHPISRPSSRSSYTHRSPGSIFVRMPSQPSSRRSSFSYQPSALYSPGSSPNQSASFPPRAYRSPPSPRIMQRASRTSSPQSIPSPRYSRPPSPPPISSPSSTSSSLYQTSALYSPGSSPSQSASVSPQMHRRPPSPRITQRASIIPTPRTPPAHFQIRTRRGFWNRRGDFLTADGYIVYAPPVFAYPPELASYPDVNVGYQDHRKVFTSHVPRPELPQSLPRHGRPPECPYEKFVVYEYT